MEDKNIGKKEMKKRLCFYLLFSFAPVYAMQMLYHGFGNEYESAGMQVILTLSMLCPGAAALLTRLITGQGLKLTGADSLMLGISFRNRKYIWYLLACILPVLWCESGWLVYYIIFPGNFDKTFPALQDVSTRILFIMPIVVIINACIISFGALGEECGWRGYLYPVLRELLGRRWAGLAGGVIWSIWHWYAIFMGHNFGHGYKGEPWSGFLVFTCFCISVGIILDEFTTRTGSVWPAAFMHAVNNAGWAGSLLACAYRTNPSGGLGNESTVNMAVTMIPVFVIALLIWVKQGKEAV